MATTTAGPRFLAMAPYSPRGAKDTPKRLDETISSLRIGSEWAFHYGWANAPTMVLNDSDGDGGAQLIATNRVDRFRGHPVPPHRLLMTN